MLSLAGEEFVSPMLNFSRRFCELLPYFLGDGGFLFLIKLGFRDENTVLGFTFDA